MRYTTPTRRLATSTDRMGGSAGRSCRLAMWRAHPQRGILASHLQGRRSARLLAPLPATPAHRALGTSPALSGSTGRRGGGFRDDEDQHTTHAERTHCVAAHLTAGCCDLSIIKISGAAPRRLRAPQVMHTTSYFVAASARRSTPHTNSKRRNSAAMCVIAPVICDGSGRLFRSSFVSLLGF